EGALLVGREMDGSAPVEAVLGLARLGGGLDVAALVGVLADAVEVAALALVVDVGVVGGVGESPEAVAAGKGIPVLGPDAARRAGDVGGPAGDGAGRADRAPMLAGVVGAVEGGIRGGGILLVRFGLDRCVHGARLAGCHRHRDASVAPGGEALVDLLPGGPAV